MEYFNIRYIKILNFKLNIKYIYLILIKIKCTIFYR